MGKFQRAHQSSVALPLLSVILLQVAFIIPSNIIQAAPTASSSPSQECPIFCRASQTSGLQYDLGEYRYQYESEIKNEVILAQTESRTTNVKAKVTLTVISPCDFLLTIKKAQVESRTGKDENNADLDGSTVRFTLEDGIINQVCVTKNDPTWSANIKRSIISLLQNKALHGVSENDVLESDVSGKCPTRYTITNGNYIKTKNLNDCNHRQGGKSVSRGIPYDTNSALNSDPYINSNQQCEQTLEGGIVKQVKCTETHKSENVPGDTDKGTMQTTISVSLTLTDKKKGTVRKALPQNLVKSSIFFDNGDSSTATRQADAETSVRNILERVCDNIQPDGLTSEVPDQLLNLKKAFAHLSKESAVKIYGEIQSGSLCQAKQAKFRKLYVDAAAFSGSDGAIGLLSQLYKSGELDKVSQRYFYLYTTFAPKPTQSALESVLPLIQGGNGAEVSKRLLLAVSGLAHQYCKISNSNCLQNSAYVAVVDRIAEIAQENCQVNDEDRIRVAIAALNALGNTDQLTGKAVTAISTCLGSGSSDRIQVQALDAFRRDPCQQSLKSQAQNIFADKNEPSNVRISAFLANLQCLQPSDARVIQTVLDDEESIQVGGFVYSQLKNLLRSNSPSTATLKSAARQLNHNLKYPQEPRKFSRNYESSLFLPNANLGYSAQGNVLFSKESFIPRQISANLTLDIYGQSYNVLQVGVYLENFDAIQERIFGPHGEFPADNEISSNDVINHVLKRARGSRSRRAIPGPVTLDKSGLNALQQKSKIQPGQETAPGIGDAFIRVFGTTVGVVSLNTERVPQVASNVRSKLENFVKGTLQSSTRDIDFVQPLLFLNLETQSPTIAGFSISNNAEGSAIPSLKYKKDFKSPSENNGNADLNLHLETDVSATLRFRTSLNAGPFEQGIELDMSFRSGDAFNLQTHREPGKKFEAKLTFPHKVIDHLEFTSNVYWTESKPGRPDGRSDFRPSLQVMPPPETCHEGPGNQLLGAALGLQFCTSTNIDLEIESLFSRKQYLRAKLQKVQPSMEGYSILLEKQKNGDERNYQLTLDTPGLPDRKIELLGHSVDDADGKRKIELELKTPSKAVSAKFEYERTNSEAEKGIKAKLILPTASLSVHGRVKINRKGENEVTYEPLLSLEYPGKRDGSVSTLKFLSGEITRVKGKSIHFDLAHELPESQLISPLDVFLKGDIRVERHAPNFKYQLEGITVGTRNRGQDGEPTAVLVLNGNAERLGPKYESDLDVKYGLELEHHLTAHKIALREPGHVKLETKVTSTRVFFLNFDLKADIARDKNAGTYKSLYSLTFGPNDRPKWVLASKTNVAATSARNFDAENTITFNFPLRNDPSEAIDITLKSHVKNVAGAEQLVDLQYLSGEKGNKGKVLIYFNRKSDNNNDFQLRVAVNCHNVNGELTHKRTTVADVPKGYTSSYRHETKLSSPSLNGETTVITVANILNQDGKKGINLQSTVTVAGHKFSLTTTLKALPEKYVADLRVTLDAKELALLESSVSGSSLSPRIQIKSNVDNIWVITLSREPQGESVVSKLDADILVTGRRVTLDVNRRREGDVRKLDADLKWDANRDPSQSIQVHSVTSIRRGSILIDSKNEITVVGKKVEVNVDANIPTDIKHGEHAVTLTLVTSDNRNFVIEYKNDLDVNPDSRKSKGQLSLNLPTTRLAADQQQQLLEWNFASLNPNLRRFIFDISADVQVTSGGEKSVTTNVRLASNKANDRRSLKAKVDVNVNSENHGVDAELTVGPKYLKTKVSSSCQGRDMNIELEADLTRSTETRRIRTVKYVLVNLPLVKVQRIEGNIAEDFEFINIRQFNIKKKHDLLLDGKNAFKYEYSVNFKNGQLQGNGHLNVKNSPVVKINLSGTINSDLVDVKGRLQHSGEKTVQVTVNVDRTNPLKHFEVSAEGTNHGFLVNLQNPSGSTVTFKNTLRYLNLEGKKTRLETDFSLDETAHTLAFALLKSGEDREDSKINLQVAKKGSDTYDFNGEVNVRGKSVSADGSVKRAEGVFEGSTNVNALGKKGSAEIKVSIQDKQRKFSIQGGPEGQVQDILTLEYTKEAHGTSKGYEGTISSEIPSFVLSSVQGPLKGSFKAEIISYNLRQQGKQLTATAEYTLPGVVTKGTTEIDLLVTNHEFRSYGRLSCQKNSDPEEFRSIDINLRREPGTINTLFKIIRNNNLNSERQNRTYGLVSETKGTQADWDHTTKLLVGNENSNSLSVHVYGKSENQGKGDCEGGLELNLPKRTISVEAQKKAKEVQVSAWLDKKNHPEQKLNVAVEYEKLTNEDGAKGYSYKATISHPSLAKALVINRRVVRFGELTLHESTTELDVFEDSANKITIEALAKYTDSNKQQLETKLSIRSDGLGLLVDGKGDIKLEPGTPAVANLQYSFKNRNGELKSRNVEIVAGREHQSILIGDRSNPELLISRSARHPEHRRRRSTTSDDTIDVRYEIHLPGMSDTRVVDIHLHPSTPPHLDIKTFTGEAGKSYELSLGYPNERQLLIGAYRTLNNQPSKLVELSVALNSTQLLSVKVKWNLPAIREVLKTASDRFGNTGEGVQSVSEAYVNELSLDIQQTFGKLADALPKLGPLRDHVRTELQEIKEEWEEDSESKALTEAVRQLIASIRASAEPLQELLENLADLPAALKKAAQNSPALVKSYQNFLKNLRHARAAVFRAIFKTLKPLVLQIQELVNRTSSKVQDDLNSTSENAIRKVKTAVDTSLAQLVEALLSRVDDITKFLDESGASPEIKEVIRSLLKYLLAKVKGEAVDASASPQEILQKARVAIQKAFGEIITVDIQNGVISALIPLPKPVNSLLDVRTAIRNALTAKAKIYYRNRLVSRVEVIKQLFRDLTRTNALTAVTKALRTRAAPHSARAVITGSQYFQTFDGKLFHFEGQCQYLLFADFVHRDVALAINFVNDNGVIKKSLVLADEDQNVVINPDFSVSQVGEGREGHHIKHEESGDIVTLSLEHDELVVTCNKALDVCTVDLNNGYYFGHVAGLLGTYNNEQYDDLRTPEGNPTTSTEAFVESWKLNQCTENPVPNHASPSSEAKALCASAFSSRWSPLSSCFKVSDPSEYLHICEDLSRENGWTDNKAVCATALAYEKTCTGISLGKVSACTNEA